MALVGLPHNIYHDPLLQCLTVQAQAALRPLCKSGAGLFQKAYTPRIFVSLTKPTRLGGRLLESVSNPLSYSTTSMNSAALTIAFDIPIDFASQYNGSLLERLRLLLPGPRKLWATGDRGKIVGLCLKKPRGTHAEFIGALLACVADGPLEYLYMTDGRLPQHLPEEVLESCQLKVLLFAGPPTPNVL